VFSKDRLGLLKLVAVFALLLAFAGVGSSPAHAGAATGAVYTLTNQASGNAVAVFDRAADGSLTPAGTVATGGLGTGAGLGSQGALALGTGNRYLFAVNAGSNNVSVLAAGTAGLELVAVAASGGQLPISLTSHNDLLYVLNAGGAGNITGFRVAPDGSLAPIAGSTRPLSGSATAPAQVQFSPDGSLLVVTEKATNRIDTYTVNNDGTAGGPHVYAASGVTPFGFAFGLRDRIFVSEAFGGAANASAVSSYGLSQDGVVSVLSGSAPTHQTAACWVAVTPNGRYAYATNAGSASISGYAIAADGTISLLDPDGHTATTGAGPIDATITIDGRFLYALTSAGHGINAFKIGADGSLSALDGVSGLLPGTVGLASK
jgi:6-phosphogluconolactonase (cycloisomerase 2 family)